MAWDCKTEIIGFDETTTHSRTEDYGITVLLQDVSPVGSHKAVVGVYFYWDEDPDVVLVLAPGEYKSYTDPEGVEWRVHVVKTVPNGASSTAEIKICYEEATPAEGEIIGDIDVPASVTEGDTVVIYTTFKNIGGTAGKLFLRYYDGTTLLRETAPGLVNPGQIIEDFAETFAMPSHAWNGKVELMRQT